MISLYLFETRLGQINDRANLKVNENTAVNLLKKYAKARDVYKKHYSFYAQAPAGLIIEENGQYTIIDPRLKVLNWAKTKQKTNSGYYFL